MQRLALTLKPARIWLKSMNSRVLCVERKGQDFSERRFDAKMVAFFTLTKMVPALMPQHKMTCVDFRLVL